MSNSQRRKGRAGEQEVARIIRDWLGLDIRRNGAEQSALGGVDLSGVAGWAIEVKYQAKDRVPMWWEQTVRQSRIVDGKPVLMFRIIGHRVGLDPEDKWQCVVRLKDIGVDVDGAATITLRSWMDWVRNDLA